MNPSSTVEDILATSVFSSSYGALPGVPWAAEFLTASGDAAIRNFFNSRVSAASWFVLSLPGNTDDIDDDTDDDGIFSLPYTDTIREVMTALPKLTHLCVVNGFVCDDMLAVLGTHPTLEYVELVDNHNTATPEAIEAAPIQIVLSGY
jgi:hypothetical protein